MARIRKVRPSWALAAALAAAVWIATPTFSALVVEDQAQAVVASSEEFGECFADGWSPPQDEGLDVSAAAKPCRPCRDRPWCDCSYNGAPRVSCNPCCYQQWSGTITCLD